MIKYTSEMIGSGQRGICESCNLPPAANGYDGCMGKVAGVMNACCGHGDKSQAYVQLNHDDYESNPNKHVIRGLDAIDYINLNKEK